MIMAAVCGDNVSCRSCSWTMLQFCQICYQTEDLLHFLVQHHVILEEWWCERCGNVCRCDLTCFSFRCDRRQVSRDSRGRRKVFRCNYKRSLLVLGLVRFVCLLKLSVSLIACGLFFPFLVLT